MRITNNMMIANSIWNINKNMERLNKAQERESTQCKIQLPSDDPIVATRAIKYRNYVATVAQYQKNVDDAISWQEVTEDALGSLGDVIKRLRELTVQASSDALSETDLADIKEEVSELKQQVVDIMNTSYAGRYVFAGYDTDEPPFAIESTSLGDKITFKGQYLSLGGPVSASISDADIISYCQTNAGQMYQSGGAQEIKYNIGFGAEIAVNVEGQNVIGLAGSNLFDTIDKLLIGLDGETSYKTAQIDATTTPATVTIQTTDFELDEILTDLDNDYDRVLAVRADLGAKMNHTSLVKDRLSNDYTTYTTLLSNNEDVDIAQANTDLSTAEAVYEASLSVAATVNGKTLIDFLV